MRFGSLRWHGFRRRLRKEGLASLPRGLPVTFVAPTPPQRRLCAGARPEGAAVTPALLQEVQSLLLNWKGPDLTTYGELVLEGTFKVRRAKAERTLFLLERVLLITKRRGEHYVYKSHISVRRASRVKCSGAVDKGRVRGRAPGRGQPNRLNPSRRCGCGVSARR